MKELHKPIPRTNSRSFQLFSKIFSFVFHPLLITLYLFLVLHEIKTSFFAGANENQLHHWIAILSLTTVLFPFLVILLLRVFNLISDAFMHSPRDRILPLIGTLIFYIWTFYFFEQKNEIPLFIKSLLLGGILSIIFDFFINIFYKVSVHTTAAGMIPGVALVLLIVDPSTPVTVLIIALLAAIFVGMIRWWLGAHTLGQIILGYTIGIAMQLAAYLILK